MATNIWVNIRSGNGLLPDGTKLLPEPMLAYDGIDIRPVSQKVFEITTIYPRGQWVNLSCAEGRISRDNILNIMAADNMAVLCRQVINSYDINKGP